MTDFTGKLKAAGELNPLVRAIERRIRTEGRDVVPVGFGTTPHREVVRFRSDPGMRRPSTQAHCMPGHECPSAQIEVSAFGFVGAMGDLPRMYSRTVLDAGRREDAERGHELQAFLDVLLHRLVSFMCRAGDRIDGVPDAGSAAPSVPSWMRAITGISTPGVADAIGAEVNRVLDHAWLFAASTRTPGGLAALVMDVVAAPAAVTEFTPRWLSMPHDQQSRLNARHSSLGGAGTACAVVGKRCRDSAGAITIAIGPVTFAQLRSLMPGRDAFAALERLICLYVGPSLAVQVAISVKSRTVRGAMLGCSEPCLLGQSAWLGDPQHRSAVIHDVRVWLKTNRKPTNQSKCSVGGRS